MYDKNNNHSLTLFYTKTVENSIYNFKKLGNNYIVQEMIKILIISAVLVIVSSVNLRTEAGSMEMIKIDQLADDIKILKGEKVLV
jgi:hypothetical protein